MFALGSKVLSIELNSIMHQIEHKPLLVQHVEIKVLSVNLSMPGAHKRTYRIRSNLQTE